MLNFYIIKVILKNGEVRYRSILTKSGKAIKSKTFRRKQDARTWGNRAVIDSQEYEAKGIKPCTIMFGRLADEYMQWWSGKDHVLILVYQLHLRFLDPVTARMGKARYLGLGRNRTRVELMCVAHNMKRGLSIRQEQYA